MRFVGLFGSLARGPAGVPGSDADAIPVVTRSDERFIDAIDAEARREAGSRSEFLRGAARLYVERQRRWARLFEMGDEVAADRGPTPQDVHAEIQLARQEKRTRG